MKKIERKRQTRKEIKPLPLQSLRIFDLKSKTQELEKFKFVLDYKIKELRKQIEPKEREIKMKNKEIEDMEGELGQISLQNHLLSLNIKTMRQNVGVKDREVGDFTVTRSTIHTEITFKASWYFPKSGGKM